MKKVKINGIEFDFEGQADAKDGKYFLSFDKAEEAKIVFEKIEDKRIKNSDGFGKDIWSDNVFIMEKLNGRTIELKKQKI